MNAISTERVFILVLGTSPEKASGGIASALPGFFDALMQHDLNYQFVATHVSHKWGGSWLPWLTSFIKSISFVAFARGSGKSPVAFLHMGGGAISTLRKTALAVFFRLGRVPTVMQLHGPEVETYLRTPVKRFVFINCLRAASSVAVLTPWWAEQLKAAGVKNPVHVIPNALHLSATDNCMDTPDREKAFQDKPVAEVLVMSRMVPGKGFEQLLEAIPLVKSQCNFLLAGGGPLETALKERVRYLGIENRVSFLGWVSGREKELLFQRCDLFCLPSNYDSFGMVYIEAMAYGLPVIAVDRGPIADVILHGETGILVMSDNAQEVASAVDQVLGDPILMRDMSARAVKVVRQKYSSKAVGKQIQNSILELI